MNLKNLFTQSCKLLPQFKRKAEVYYAYILAKFFLYNSISYCKNRAKEKIMNCIKQILDQRINRGVQTFKKGSKVMEITLNYMYQVQF